MTIIISAATGAIVSALGVWLKNTIDLRTKIDENLREIRINVYKDLWTKTRLLSRFPDTRETTHQELRELSNVLKDWYFDEGGMYLSCNARKKYYDLQQALLKAVAHEEAGGIHGRQLETLSQLGTAFREELAKDLVSRRRGF